MSLIHSFLPNHMAHEAAVAQSSGDFILVPTGPALTRCGWEPGASAACAGTLSPQHGTSVCILLSALVLFSISVYTQLPVCCFLSFFASCEPRPLCLLWGTSDLCLSLFCVQISSYFLALGASHPEVWPSQLPKVTLGWSGCCTPVLPCSSPLELPPFPRIYFSTEHR